ncbi:hypothetical protein BV25DRAFT_1048522 [Artomyces pyxidatus]|uniref:Uncharacterized protein n=1 Tax=Artomyces pyxidatus TaxID=48021 RepID=A0ACB8STR5_9AGAM|nr:hypothetical protein BV25DRAFT_1048522 [Artomyces pyxidatus]
MAMELYLRDSPDDSQIACSMPVAKLHAMIATTAYYVRAALHYPDAGLPTVQTNQNTSTLYTYIAATTKGARCLCGNLGSPFPTLPKFETEARPRMASAVQTYCPAIACPPADVRVRCSSSPLPQDLRSLKRDGVHEYTSTSAPLALSLHHSLFSSRLFHRTDGRLRQLEHHR